MRSRVLCTFGGVVLASGSLFAQVSPSKDQAAVSPAALPVINETVPPPFNNYPLGPDSLPHPDVPHGKIMQFQMKDSSVFQNTIRTIQVYIPAEYDGNKPACTFVFLDAILFKATTVFDNLIAQHAMPVTIAIGVASGFVNSAHVPEDGRFERSYEFDDLSDRLARFLLTDVIPAVESRQTPDGLPIKLSSNPDDRGIAGASTGGIGAFNVAWTHPEAFHRVFSSIGTFVGMRGGESLYVQVRKTEPKPLRVFLEDGVNDEWAGAEMGDWYMSNLTMSRALEFVGYDVHHIWGAGTHAGGHANAIFPEAMRWLWRDWPVPVKAAVSTSPGLKPVLLPGETWSVAAAGCAGALVLQANPAGKVLYGADGSGLITLEGTTGSATCASAAKPPVFAVDADGRMYSAGLRGVEVTSPGQKAVKLADAEHLSVSALAVRNNGDVYALSRSSDVSSELWLLPTHGTARKLDELHGTAAGLAFSPDGLWLTVTESDSRFGLNYRLKDDGTVDSREPYYEFYVPPDGDKSGASQIAMDTEGRAYVATAMGIQVMDRVGRVCGILPLPSGEAATGVAFGGSDFSTLFVAAGGKIYVRKLRVKGVPAWSAPIKLSPGASA